MTARTPTAHALPLSMILITLVPALHGCSGLSSHRENKIPQYGVIDPNQPREFQMVSHPAYTVEPPDELEVTVKPAVPDISLNTLVVQTDGTIDLGFGGDIYVAGLTLEQTERKIATHLYSLPGVEKPKQPYDVSVRLVNGSASKFYYVLGTVTTQGKFPITGNETVLDAILAAGLRSNSLPEKAYLVRPHPAGGPDLVLRVDWFGIKDRGDSLTNYQLFPGDRLVVPGGKPPGLLSTLFGGN